MILGKQIAIREDIDLLYFFRTEDVTSDMEPGWYLHQFGAALDGPYDSEERAREKAKTLTNGIIHPGAS
jgi:hypothetical protein